MKKISRFICMTLSLSVFFSLPQLSAQNNTDNTTVSQKITDQNGNVTVKKKRFNAGEDVNDFLEKMSVSNGDNVEVTVAENGETITIIQSGNTNNQMQTLLSAELENMEEIMEQVEQDMAKLQERKQEKKHKNYTYHYNYNYNYDYNYDHEDTGKKRALLGIYPSYTDQGVMISSLVSGGGAQAAGMKSGDQVVSINGNVIQTGRDLRNELSKYEPGTVVTAAYIRDGQNYTAQTTLGEQRSNSTHRDPCKIFIGVQLSGADRGVSINGIINGTAADKSDLQTGDVILEMDGIAVNSFDELLVERNKHQPGDDFVLTVLRNNQRQIVEAQFLNCDEEATGETPAEEVIEPTITPESAVQFVGNDLGLEELKAFPNPTYGKFTLQFRGEAVPTTIRVTDITGKTVFSENLNRFDGLYSRELSIDNATPGNMIVTIQQGNKLISEQILLLPRA